jgi:hypothetical protein
MVEIQIGDVVQTKTGAGGYHAVVRAVRLGRLIVERCDGRTTGPLAIKDVAVVFKAAGAPIAATPKTEPLRPTAQMKLL